MQSGVRQAMAPDELHHPADPLHRVLLAVERPLELPVDLADPDLEPGLTAHGDDASDLEALVLAHDDAVVVDDIGPGLAEQRNEGLRLGADVRNQPAEARLGGDQVAVVEAPDRRRVGEVGGASGQLARAGAGPQLDVGGTGPLGPEQRRSQGPFSVALDEEGRPAAGRDGGAEADVTDVELGASEVFRTMLTDERSQSRPSQGGPLRLVDAAQLPEAALRRRPYRFSNRSTRPAVSTIFIWPVKNGWLAAEISTLASG